MSYHTSRGYYEEIPLPDEILAPDPDDEKKSTNDSQPSALNPQEAQASKPVQPQVSIVQPTPTPHSSPVISTSTSLPSTSAVPIPNNTVSSPTNSNLRVNKSESILNVSPQHGPLPLYAPNFSTLSPLKRPYHRHRRSKISNEIGEEGLTVRQHLQQQQKQLNLQMQQQRLEMEKHKSPNKQLPTPISESNPILKQNLQTTPPSSSLQSGLKAKEADSSDIAVRNIVESIKSSYASPTRRRSYIRDTSTTKTNVPINSTHIVQSLPMDGAQPPPDNVPTSKPETAIKSVQHYIVQKSSNQVGRPRNPVYTQSLLNIPMKATTSGRTFTSSTGLQLPSLSSQGSPYKYRLHQDMPVGQVLMAAAQRQNIVNSPSSTTTKRQFVAQRQIIANFVESNNVDDKVSHQKGKPYVYLSKNNEGFNIDRGYINKNHPSQAPVTANKNYADIRHEFVQPKKGDESPQKGQVAHVYERAQNLVDDRLPLSPNQEVQQILANCVDQGMTVSVNRQPVRSYVPGQRLDDQKFMAKPNEERLQLTPTKAQMTTTITQQFVVGRKTPQGSREIRRILSKSSAGFQPIEQSSDGSKTDQQQQPLALPQNNSEDLERVPSNTKPATLSDRKSKTKSTKRPMSPSSDLPMQKQVEQKVMEIRQAVGLQKKRAEDILENQRIQLENDQIEEMKKTEFVESCPNPYTSVKTFENVDDNVQNVKTNTMSIDASIEAVISGSKNESIPRKKKMTIPATDTHQISVFPMNSNMPSSSTFMPAPNNRMAQSARDQYMNDGGVFKVPTMTALKRKREPIQKRVEMQKYQPPKVDGKLMPQQPIPYQAVKKVNNTFVPTDVPVKGPVREIPPSLNINRMRKKIEANRLKQQNLLQQTQLNNDVVKKSRNLDANVLLHPNQNKQMVDMSMDPEMMKRFQQRDTAKRMKMKRVRKKVKAVKRTDYELLKTMVFTNPMTVNPSDPWKVKRIIIPNIGNIQLPETVVDDITREYLQKPNSSKDGKQERRSVCDFDNFDPDIIRNIDTVEKEFVRRYEIDEDEKLKKPSVVRINTRLNVSSLSDLIVPPNATKNITTEKIKIDWNSVRSGSSTSEINEKKEMKPIVDAKERKQRRNKKRMNRIMNLVEGKDVDLMKIRKIIVNLMTKTKTPDKAALDSLTGIMLHFLIGNGITLSEFINTECYECDDGFRLENDEYPEILKNLESTCCADFSEINMSLIDPNVIDAKELSLIQCGMKSLEAVITEGFPGCDMMKSVERRLPLNDGKMETQHYQKESNEKDICDIGCLLKTFESFSHDGSAQETSNELPKIIEPEKNIPLNQSLKVDCDKVDLNSLDISKQDKKSKSPNIDLVAWMETEDDGMWDLDDLIKLCDEENEAEKDRKDDWITSGDCIDPGTLDFDFTKFAPHLLKEIDEINKTKPVQNDEESKQLNIELENVLSNVDAKILNKAISNLGKTEVAGPSNWEAVNNIQQSVKEPENELIAEQLNGINEDMLKKFESMDMNTKAMEIIDNFIEKQLKLMAIELNSFPGHMQQDITKKIQEEVSEIRTAMKGLKMKMIKKNVISLVYSNGALVDEVSRLSHRINTCSEERKILARRLLHHFRNYIRRLQTAVRKKKEYQQKLKDAIKEAGPNANVGKIKAKLAKLKPKMPTLVQNKKNAVSMVMENTKSREEIRREALLEYLKTKNANKRKASVRKRLSNLKKAMAHTYTTTIQRRNRKRRKIERTSKLLQVENNLRDCLEQDDSKAFVPIKDKRVLLPKKRGRKKKVAVMLKSQKNKRMQLVKNRSGINVKCESRNQPGRKAKAGLYLSENVVNDDSFRKVDDSNGQKRISNCESQGGARTESSETVTNSRPRRSNIVSRARNFYEEIDDSMEMEVVNSKKEKRVSFCETVRRKSIRKLVLSTDDGKKSENPLKGILKKPVVPVLKNADEPGPDNTKTVEPDRSGDLKRQSTKMIVPVIPEKPQEEAEEAKTKVKIIEPAPVVEKKAQRGRPRRIRPVEKPVPIENKEEIKQEVVDELKFPKDDTEEVPSKRRRTRTRRAILQEEMERDVESLHLFGGIEDVDRDYIPVEVEKKTPRRRSKRILDIPNMDRQDQEVNKTGDVEIAESSADTSLEEVVVKKRRGRARKIVSQGDTLMESHLANEKKPAEADKVEESSGSEVSREDEQLLRRNRIKERARTINMDEDEKSPSIRKSTRTSSRRSALGNTPVRESKRIASRKS